MRIGIVGDSQSEGLAPFLIPLLEARGDHVVDSMLERGMSLRSMRASPEKQSRARAVANQADVLVVILGGNNRIDNQSAYQDQVRWFLSQVAARPREIWWVGPAASIHPEWGFSHSRTRELQRRIFAYEPRVKWIDAWPMTQRGVQYAPDNLHFTRAGYREWSGRLIGVLSSRAALGLLIGAGLIGVSVGLFVAIATR